MIWSVPSGFIKIVLSRFAKADFSLDQDAFCAAYINFLNQEDVYLFQERFDGYVFVDNKGNEYVAMVEFAPNQKIAAVKEKNENANWFWFKIFIPGRGL